MMGHKLEKGTLNFKTLMAVLEADVNTCKNGDKGLKTLYEDEVGNYINKML